MKIGLIIQHADPARGGAERYTIDIALALSHRGHDVAILAGDFSDAMPWEVRQVKLESRSVGKAMSYRRFINSYETHLQSGSYDILHAMVPVPWCDLYHPHAGLAAELIAEGHLKYPSSMGQTMAKLGNRLNLK